MTLLAACAVAGGCAGYRPAPIDPVALAAGAATQHRHGISVSVFVPGDDQVERLFGVPLAKRGIQPVGLVIVNHSENAYWFTPLALDPDYFTPIEAANRARYFFSGSANERMREHFLDSAISSYVGPGERISGFVFTSLSRGVKPVNVDLIGPYHLVQFYFTISVGNLSADYHEIDHEKLYAPEELREVGEAKLRAALEAMPCCATTEDGSGMEDPLNFVLVGQADEVFANFTWETPPPR